MCTQRLFGGTVDRPARILVVDDDPTLRLLIQLGLEQAGFEVTAVSSGKRALAETTPPDAVVVDLMMPGMDGVELCRQLRAHPVFHETRIVVASAKAYETDRRAALAAGADVYRTKPVNLPELSDTLMRLIEDRIDVGFWGVRGTLPAPSKAAIRYGGNTSCVTVELPRGQRFIFDAGSGIRALGGHLMATGTRHAGAILITHPHWDHLNALPFFAPLYVPGNQYQICGPAQPGARMRDLVAAQMDGRFFPITPLEFGADITYTDLREGKYRILDTEVATILLMHPGTCLGYKLTYGGRSVAYITDQELGQPDLPGHSQSYVDNLVRFLHGVDLLITDTTYTDAEYPSKVGWGHSSVSQVARLAHRASVKTLCIAHHDPSQTDDDIDAKLADCRAALSLLDSKVTALAPAEGDLMRI